MKKIIITLSLICSLTILKADNPLAWFEGGLFSGKYADTYLQVQLLPFPLFRLFGEGITNNGLAVNLLGKIGKNRGFSFNGIYHRQGNNHGLNIGGIQSVVYNYGVNVGLVNYIDYLNDGVQIGIVNTYDSSFFKGNSGVDIALANIIPVKTYEVIYNYPNNKKTIVDSKNNCQIGLYNHAANGLQIGVINYNSNSYLPWMIGFNYSNIEDKNKEQKE